MRKPMHCSRTKCMIVVRNTSIGLTNTRRMSIRLVTCWSYKQPCHPLCESQSRSVSALPAPNWQWNTVQNLSRPLVHWHPCQYRPGCQMNLHRKQVLNKLHLYKPDNNGRCSCILILANQSARNYARCVMQIIAKSTTNTILGSGY